MATNRDFATKWVHMFEEDTPDGAVYRPETEHVPLSRRPRERLVLNADGTAHIYGPGADDRSKEQKATWHEEGDRMVVRAAGPGVAPRELEIVEESPDRLVVKRR